MMVLAIAMLMVILIVIAIHDKSACPVRHPLRLLATAKTICCKPSA